LEDISRKIEYIQDIDFNYKSIQIPIQKILDSKIDIEFLDLHGIKISKNLIIIGISAEPMIEYKKIFKSIFNEPNLLCIGCMNTVFWLSSYK